jgi:class 3 adenylate cyclase
MDLAAGIGKARFVGLPGADHMAWMGDGEDLAAEIEEFLTGERHEPEGDRILSTVLFTDIVGSTRRAAQLGDRRWRDVLDRHDAVAQRTIDQFRGRIVKSTGDGLLATFDGPARGIRSACALREGLQGLGVQVRAGLHTGEVEKMGEDLGGIAVHIAQRVSAIAQAGEVLVSRTVVDLVAGSGIRFEDRGEQQLKGVPSAWRVFAVSG